MDKESRALTGALPEGIPDTLAARAAHFNVALSTLGHRKLERQSREAKADKQRYLTRYEANAVVEFLLQQKAFGTPVRMKHVAAIAFSATRNRPLADRPLKPPGPNWAKAFEKHSPELLAKKNRPQDWNRHNIYDKVKYWFEVIGKELQNPAILPENVYNMDETGIMLSMLNSVKVLVGKDDTHAYRGARVKRTMVTAVECISADGRSLNPMIIWPVKTHRANWTTYPTPGWVYAISDTGFTDSYISLQWLKLVFDPQTKERANMKPRVLIWDGLGTHETLEILEFCFENNITLCRMPSHCSHKLQPCDVGVFGPLKTAYREQVERMELGGVNTVGKQHFTYLYGPARGRAFTKRNILGAWRGSGLFPFNPNRVLAEIPKPPTDLTISTADEPRINLRPDYEALPTPATPVSGETLISLLDMIKHAPNDEANSQHKARLQQKVANAAQTYLAKIALLSNRNQFLAKINNEGKARRAADQKIIGTARAAEKKAKKAAKEAKRVASAGSKAEGAAAGMKKRGRKRKSASPEQDASNPAQRAKVLRTSETRVEEIEIIQQLYRAPEAKMY
ncbi:DDE-1 domain containing protein [Pyrenophora tritici-repentis]|nr:DDE-1 domain containing protein [Pyrenophora tritici-repentis]